MKVKKLEDKSHRFKQANDQNLRGERGKLKERKHGGNNKMGLISWMRLKLKDYVDDVKKERAFNKKRREILQKQYREQSLKEAEEQGKIKAQQETKRMKDELKKPSPTHPPLKDVMNNINDSLTGTPKKDNITEKIGKMI